MQNRFHTFTFFVFCIAKKICQENPAVIHYVGVRFPNGRNLKCPKENFSVCKYIFLKKLTELLPVWFMKRGQYIVQMR